MRDTARDVYITSYENYIRSMEDNLNTAVRRVQWLERMILESNSEEEFERRNADLLAAQREVRQLTIDFHAARYSFHRAIGLF